ncbi:MAG TPA: MBL fold metallo-hydrolase, partial [Caldithrix sp.]|nr:MBL fold metallo-hydrolase [Caldithrix sp.]
MRITFLGTGTSQGVPIINCDCPVCTSGNPKNKRMRCSVMIETSCANILIDTSIDMYQQFIAWPFKRIDAILYTHAHADHIFGLDELRRFNYLQKEVIPVYGNAETMNRIRHVFDYALNDGPFVSG